MLAGGASRLHCSSPRSGRSNVSKLALIVPAPSLGNCRRPRKRGVETFLRMAPVVGSPAAQFWAVCGPRTGRRGSRVVADHGSSRRRVFLPPSPLRCGSARGKTEGPRSSTASCGLAEEFGNRPWNSHWLVRVRSALYERPGLLVTDLAERADGEDTPMQSREAVREFRVFISARPSLTHRVNGGSLPTRTVNEGLEAIRIPGHPHAEPWAWRPAVCSKPPLAR
jgi:hypothetical protein